MLNLFLYQVIKLLSIISKTHLFLFFQRLVEAAEDAYLKHEFDADLQVVNNSFLECLSSEYIYDGLYNSMLEELM